jgi:hypothetical protein
MEETSWAELGIAPTGDQAAVRRAYATRLKAIDADRDPAAFMRLRQAYEDALAAKMEADKPEEDGDEERPGNDHEFPSRPQESSPAAAAAWGGFAVQSSIDVAFPDRFGQTFQKIIAAGDTRAASRSLKAALAEGIVEIGQERELVRRLAVCGLADKTLSPDEIDEIGRTFGAERAHAGDWVSESLQDLLVRADAARWQARILRNAQLGDIWMIGYVARILIKRVRIARAIRHTADQNLMVRDLPTLRIEVMNARRYARWITGQIDQGPLEEKLQRLERTLRAQEIQATVIGIVIILLLSFVNGWLGLMLGMAFATAVIWAFFFS